MNPFFTREELRLHGEPSTTVVFIGQRVLGGCGPRCGGRCVASGARQPRNGRLLYCEPPEARDAPPPPPPGDGEDRPHRFLKWAGPWQLDEEGMWRRRYRRYDGLDAVHYGPWPDDA